jgi:hypothetical protein
MDTENLLNNIIINTNFHDKFNDIDQDYNLEIAKAQWELEKQKLMENVK